MNSNRVRLALIATFLVASSLFFLRATDWKTTDGKTYSDVKVVHSDADSVTILDQDGGARIPLDHLPTDVQKLFNYDPVAAKAAADARAKEAAANAKQLQAEMNQASALHQAGAIQTTPTNVSSGDAAPGTSTAANEWGAHSRMNHPPMSGDTSTRRTREESLSSIAGNYSAQAPSGNATGFPNVSNLNQRGATQTTAAGAQNSASTHHSMDDLFQSSTAMRPSLSDPTYHTMGHLVYMVNQQGMGPGTSDPNHRTISQAAAPNNQPATTGAVTPVKP